MGTVCCVEDRGTTETEGKREVRDAVAAAKDAEAAIPRMREVATTLWVSLESVKKHDERAFAAIMSYRSQWKVLTQELSDQMDLGRVLLTRKSVRRSVTQNAILLKSSDQSPEALASIILEPMPVCSNIAGEYVAQWLQLLHEKDREKAREEELRVAEEIQAKGKGIRNLGDVVDQGKREIGVITSRLSGSVQKSLASLSEDLSDFQPSKLTLLKDAIAHDSELAALGHTAKPSYLYERLLELMKERSEINNAALIFKQKAAFYQGEIDQMEKQTWDLEKEAAAVVKELQTVIIDARQVSDRSDSRRETSRSHLPDDSADSLHRLHTVKESLTQEEIQLKAASENLSELHRTLTTSQERKQALKARVFMMVLKLQSMRVALLALRRWRILIETRALPSRKRQESPQLAEDVSDTSEGVESEVRKVPTRWTETRLSR